MSFIKNFFKGKDEENTNLEDNNIVYGNVIEGDFLKESKEIISSSKEIENVDLIDAKNNLEDNKNTISDDKKVENNNLPVAKEDLKENKDDYKIQDKAKKEIDEILNSSDLDKVKYLFLRLFKLYFGCTPNVEITGNNVIKFIFEGFYFKKGIDSFYLDIIETYQGEKNIIYKYGELNFKDHNFNLSIDKYEKNFYKLNLTGKLKDKDILFLKGLAEQYLLSNNFLEKESIDFDINKIKEGLKDLENIDISLSSNNINILFKNKLNEDNFNGIFNRIIKENTNYYVGTGNSILREDINLIHKSFMSYIKELSFSKLFKENNLYISLPNKIDSIFWNDIIYPLIKGLSEYDKKEDNEEHIVKKLKDIGTVVELPSEKQEDFNKILDSKGFVGYEDILDKIETNIILPWKNKEDYIKKANEISPKLVKDILPNAVLFHGAPGTGKTTISSAIGNYLNYPFVYLPVQKIMSKWYGESEQKLDYIFENIGKLGKLHNGVVFMIDEIDEIGKNREKSHEATAKLTGILLKKLDGLERLDNLLLIGATNLKDSLDNALLSRFSEDLEFRLPNKEEIKEIFNFYIPGIKITDEMIKKLEQVSGRDIRNISKQITKLSIKENKDVNDVVKDYFNKM